MQAFKEFGEDGFNEMRNLKYKLSSLNKAQNLTFEKFKYNTMFPTFWESVQYIINDYKEIKYEAVYSHIRPIYEHCCVCDESYEKLFRYILKLEKMVTEERNFIKSMPGWEAQIIPKQPKLNVQRPSHLSSEDITKLYFTQLSSDDVLRLYTLYEIDFLLFDYAFEFKNASAT